jgi:type IV pilus assembly protein PilC
MALYRYEAVSTDGRVVRGDLDAADERAAAAILKTRELFVARLSATTARVAVAKRRRGRLRTRHLVFFFRELALMTRSGVTLLRALQVCEGRRSGGAEAALAGRIAGQLRVGHSLSQALAGEPAVPRLAVRLVESGEATGELDPALDRVADIIDRRATLRRNLLTSLAYPSIVFVVALAVAIFLVLGIVPKFAAFFARRGIEMPWTTQALLDLSLWVRTNGLYVLAVVGVVVAAGACLYLTRRGRVMLDRSALRVPIVGRLWQVASFSQISWTLGALLRSGVGLLESIRIAAAALGNRALGEHLCGTADRILEGEPLSAGLEHALVPPVVPNLIAAGEQSGAMTEVLDELARFYQRDLELRIRRMSSLIEPALILVVGGMVGFVYLAFFQALMQLAQR